MRGTYDEPLKFSSDGMYINGVFAKSPYKHIVRFKGFSKSNQFTVNLPDWRIFTVTVDNETANFDNENIFSHRRELNFITGLITRNFIFKTKTGKEVAVESVRMVNRENTHGAEVKYSVTPLNFEGEVTVESTVVKNTQLGNGFFTFTDSEDFDDDTYTILKKVPSTEQFASISVSLKVDAENYEKSINNTDEIYNVTFKCNLKRNQNATFYKFAAFAGTIDGFEKLTDYTKNLVSENTDKGFDFFVEEQKNFWDKHWEDADIKISGNPSDQQAVRYNLFQLKQQLPSENHTSIGATGLTGPGYSGMVFWDTEMYLMPYYNFTAPASQKELLMYRYKILDKARERAKEFDTVGAMYAWCSIDGEETSVVFEASTAEYHLNSDISYAIWRYVDSTEDYDFLYNYGAEIVFETAKFMSHRGAFIETKGGKFCINAVCGPDEYACGVNNNFYTNLSAKKHFEYASSVVNDMKANVPEKFEELCDRIGLTQDDISLWEKAAEKMYLPYSDEYGIYKQDDSYLYQDPVDMNEIPMYVDLRGLYHPLDLWRLQVSKQADVCLASFLFGDFFTEEQKIKCYDYYEPRCNHGSSLSPAIYSIAAEELDRKKDAYEFFRCAAYMDIFDIKRNTNKGIHIACSGGVWMSVVNGYLGLRHYNDGLTFKPSIPDVWDSYNCRIVYKNAKIEVTVDKIKANFKLISGNNFRFTIGDKKIELSINSKEYSYLLNNKSIL